MAVEPARFAVRLRWRRRRLRSAGPRQQWRRGDAP
jgi:hypothetical protein